MATFDLQEQDQLDELKAWWAQHGKRVSIAIIALCIAFIGVQGWRWYHNNQMNAASALYSAVSEGARAQDAAKSKDAMAELANRYGGTPYAPRAALVYAKQLWDAGDKAGARAQLDYVLARADSPDLTAIARYRLAEAALDEGKSDDALKLLDAKVDDAYAALYADLRGDALTAAGRRDEARAAY
jgi:predicted negative regulator of RcsB-dependent stress response